MGTVEICALMTNWATHCAQPEIVRTALDRRLMQTAGSALARAVAGRVAVDAARMLQHLAKFGKERDRALS